MTQNATPNRAGSQALATAIDQLETVTGLHRRADEAAVRPDLPESDKIQADKLLAESGDAADKLAVEILGLESHDLKSAYVQVLVAASQIDMAKDDCPVEKRADALALLDTGLRHVAKTLQFFIRPDLPQIISFYGWPPDRAFASTPERTIVRFHEWQARRLALKAADTVEASKLPDTIARSYDAHCAQLSIELAQLENGIVEARAKTLEGIIAQIRIEATIIGHGGRGSAIEAKTLNAIADNLARMIGAHS